VFGASQDWRERKVKEKSGRNHLIIRDVAKYTPILAKLPIPYFVSTDLHAFKQVHFSPYHERPRGLKIKRVCAMMLSTTRSKSNPRVKG
jgi:hypothetical protein